MGLKLNENSIIFDQFKEPRYRRIHFFGEHFWLKLHPKLAPPRINNPGYVSVEWVRGVALY